MRVDESTRQRELMAAAAELGRAEVRWHRKLGADRFLRVTLEGRGKYSLEETRSLLLRPFGWMGRWWVCLRARCKQQRGKHGEIERRRLFARAGEGSPIDGRSVTFFAERCCSPQEEEFPEFPLACRPPLLSVGLPVITAQEARRLHIPVEVRSTCPAGCRQHILCAQGVPRRPEDELFRTPAKYAKRLDLGFTDAKPTIVFEAKQIVEAEDLVNEAAGGRSVLTDGCGRIGLRAADRVRLSLGLKYIPAVFQGRLGSCKGLWIVDLRLGDGIEVRRAMRKWEIDWASCNVQDRTFEVKDHAKQSSNEACLNSQLIAVLEARGVPASVFLGLQAAHVQTFGEDKFSDADRAVASLAPFAVALEGKTRLAVEMLDAGLDPQEEPAGMKWMLDYQVAVLRRIRSEAHYACPLSWRALMAPDFTRTLLPSECVFKLPGDGGYVEGEVVVSRSPCTAPWDVQKLRALGHVELLARCGSGGLQLLHENVLLLSAHGTCSYAPAHYLAGGDYDGDVALIIAHGPIASGFRSAAYDDTLVEELNRMTESPGSSCRPGESVVDGFRVVADAHYADVENSFLVGSLGNQWAFKADQEGVDAKSAVLTGLAFQLALDGKLPPGFKLDGSLSPAPHWHAKARKGAPKSTRALGQLSDALDLEELADQWRLKHGGRPYKIVDRSPLKVPSRFCIQGAEAYFDEARNFLARYFAKASECMGAKAKRDAFPQLRAQMRLDWLPDSLDPRDRMCRAAALYHAQADNFSKRLTQGLGVGNVEWLLCPAWDLCGTELCRLHATHGGTQLTYALAPERRPRMQYR